MNNKEVIEKFIYEYFCKYAKEPEFWEIEEATGIGPSPIARNIPDYDKNLRTSLIEKKVMDLYGRYPDKKIAEMLDVLPSNVSAVIYRLRKKGKLEQAKKYSRSDDQRTYIKVIEGLIERRNRTINLKGCGGYIEKVIKGYSECYVYKDKKAYKIKLKENQYEVVG